MKNLIITILLGILLLGAYKPNNPKLVRLTDDSANNITAKKIINVVPGDIIVEGTPFESPHYDTETYTSTAGIVHVENTGLESSNCHIEIYVGPIGDKGWIKIGDRNQPSEPGETWFWTYTNAIYCDSIKFIIWVDAGECDVHQNMILSKSGASTQ